MAGFLGRDITLEVGDGSPLEEVPGVQEKGISVAGEPIDVSADDSNGWRELLTEAGQNQVDISNSGVTKSSLLREMIFAGDRTKEIRVTYPDGGIIAGQFFLASYNETGTYNGATTFECQWQSSGPVVYTPGTP